MTENLDGFAHTYSYDPYEETIPHLVKPDMIKLSLAESKDMR